MDTSLRFLEGVKDKGTRFKGMGVKVTLILGDCGNEAPIWGLKENEKGPRS